MDDSKIFTGIKTDEKHDSSEMKTENYYVFGISTEDQEIAASVLAPKLERNFKESDKFPDNQQENKNDDNLHERIVPITSETKLDEIAKNVTNRDSDYDDYSTKENKNVELKKKDCTYEKDEARSSKTLKDKLCQLFSQKNIYNLHTDKDIKILKEKENQIESQGFEYPKVIEGSINQTERNVGILEKIVKDPSAESKSQPTSDEQKDTSKESLVKPAPIIRYMSAVEYFKGILDKSEDTPKVLTRPTFTNELRDIAETTSKPSKIRSPKQVLAHVQSSMQSKRVEFERNMAVNISKEELKNPDSNESTEISQNLKPRHNLAQHLKKLGKIKSPEKISKQFRRRPNPVDIYRSIVSRIGKQKMETPIESEDDSPKSSKVSIEQNFKEVGNYVSDTESGNATSVSVHPPCARMIPYSDSSKVRTAEEVLEHFRCFMQSDSLNTDRNLANDINEEDIEMPLESENSDATMDIVVGRKSKRVRSDLSPTQSDNATASKRQRIVHNERFERIRWWIIQQIKDREVVLKFYMMKGQCSEDKETKLKCIDEAKVIQTELDKLYDALDDHGKLEYIPPQLKDFWRSADNLSYELTSDKGTEKSITSLDSEGSENPIKTLYSLFTQLYLNRHFEFDINFILERIDTRKFIAAYNSYLNQKNKLDMEARRVQQEAFSTVSDFQLSLDQLRSKVRRKIPRSNMKSLKDYQEYINDLLDAVFDNLECLNTIIPLATSVVFPLMAYVSLSRKQVTMMFAFLREERPELFTRNSYLRNKFFDSFCQRYFKH